MTTTRGDFGKVNATMGTVILAVIGVAVYLTGLSFPLVGPDESRYAQVAREMFERGDWLTPTLAGIPWFEKPPLLYWFEIASFHIFGITEFAARFGPAVCGLAVIATLWLFARRGIGATRASSNWLLIISLSAFSMVVFSRTAGFDIVVTLPLTAALTGFFIFDRQSSSTRLSRWPLAAFWMSIGIAILAKGLIGIIFPFATVILYYIASRKWPARAFLKSAIWGLPLMLAIALPWHWIMYQRHGFEFIDVYFIQNHFERFATDRFRHPQPFYFFWWVLPLMALPWIPFAIAARWHRARSFFLALKTRNVSPVTLTSEVTFALCWVAVPLVFFSFSDSKLPGYILPAVPPVLVLSWLAIRQAVKASSRWRIAVSSTAFVTLAAVAFGAVFVLPHFAERDSVKGLIEAADARGYADDPVLTLHMTSYNAEFYAAGRLRRDRDGNQLKLEGPQNVLQEINDNAGETVLVLVPTEYVSQLTDYSRVNTVVLRDNGDLAIVAVSPQS